MQKLVYKNPDGEEIDFTSGDFGVTKWKGFSKVDMEVQSQQVPFHDGSVFLDALLGERELSVTVAVNDDGDLEKRYRLKRELIHCLNPKLGEGELIYTNDYTSKKIVCVPDIPEFDNKNMNDSGTMKAMCSFTASNPYWEDVEETIISCPTTGMVTITNNGDVPVSPEILLVTKKNKSDYYFFKNLSTKGLLEMYLPSPSGFLLTSCRQGQKKSVGGTWDAEWVGNRFGPVVFNPVDMEYWYFNPFKLLYCVGIGNRLSNPEGIQKYKKIPYASILNCVIDWNNNTLWGVSNQSHLFKYTENGFEDYLTAFEFNGLMAMGDDGYVVAVEQDIKTVMVIKEGSYWEDSAQVNFINLCVSAPGIGRGVVLATEAGEIGFVNSVNSVSWTLPSLPNVMSMTYGNNTLYASTNAGIFKLNNSLTVWEQIYSSGVAPVALTYMDRVGLFCFQADEVTLIDDNGDSKKAKLPFLCNNIYNFSGAITIIGDGICKSYGGVETYETIPPQYPYAYNTICKGDKYVSGGLYFTATSSDGKNWTASQQMPTVFNKIIWVEKYKSYYGATSQGLMKSIDGLNWDYLINITDSSIERGVFSDIVAGEDGKIICSSTTYYYKGSLDEYQYGGIWESSDGTNFEFKWLATGPLYTIIYSIEEGRRWLGCAMGKEGGYCYRDGNRWYNATLPEMVDFVGMMEINKTIYAVGKNGMIGEKLNREGTNFPWHIKQLSIDGNNFTDALNAIKYDSTMKVFFICGYNLIAYSGNGENWDRLGETFGSNVKGLIVQDKEIVVASGNVGIFTFKEGENRIKYIEALPSFDFPLMVGENKLTIESLDKTAVAVIYMKQKYLGV